MSTEVDAREAWLDKAMGLVTHISELHTRTCRYGSEGLHGAWTKVRVELLDHLRTTPEGFVLVPVEPTWAMTNAADDALGGSSFHDINKTYTAMIAAAQEGK